MGGNVSWQSVHMTAGEIAIWDDGPAIRALVQLPGCPAARVLAAFTDPAVVAQWWGGGELTTDLVPDGRYHVHFAGPGQTLTGQVLRYDPRGRLDFSWAWANEADQAPCEVRVAADGQTLRIEHGPHTDDERGRAARADHRAGWEYFLPKLAAALAG
jgi:uncharacterized protein YndB with AHSA1/START domain